MIIYGYPRTTGDLDLWVEVSEENYNQLVNSFNAFGLPIFDMTLDNFLDTNTFDVFRFGRPPLSIDIITKLKGLDFKEAFEQADFGVHDDLQIRVINYNHLIQAKRASGRAKDINDIENLKDINNDKTTKK